MSAIQLEGVSRHWADSRALDGITFAADAGSFVVLLGPSGCGKSTTLRLIAGLDTPTAGTIRIGGRDVTHLAPALTIPIVHTVELLDWAYGGAKPDALKHVRG